MCTRVGSFFHYWGGAEDYSARRPLFLLTVYCEVPHLFALQQVLEQDFNSLHVALLKAHIWMALREHIAESKQTSSFDGNNGA